MDLEFDGANNNNDFENDLDFDDDLGESQDSEDVILTDGGMIENAHLSHLVGKPTMWFPTRFDTNRPVQSQKRARSLKFWI